MSVPKCFLVESDRIKKGHCIVKKKDGKVFYAGPLNRAWLEEGDEVLLHPKDYKMLEIATRDRFH